MNYCATCSRFVAFVQRGLPGSAEQCAGCGIAEADDAHTLAVERDPRIPPGTLYAMPSIVGAWSVQAAADAPLSSPVVGRMVCDATDRIDANGVRFNNVR